MATIRMPEGDVDIIEQVNKFKDNMKTQAELLVCKELPKRIVALNTLLADPMFNLENPELIHCDVNIPIPDPAIYYPELCGVDASPASKKRKLDNNGEKMDNNDISNEPPRTIPGTKIYLLPNGVSPSNAKILKLMESVKPYLRQLVDDANMLKMWVSFLIPKIEDGNNFGVSIQEDTLGEIRAVESEAAAFYDGIARYFSTRASILCKMIKFPHIEDYRRVIFELDEKEYFSLRIVLLEVRNHYALLHDIITKNLDKIRKPRNQHVESLY